MRCVGLHHVYNVSEPHFNRGSLRRSLRAFARSTRWRQSRSDTSTPKKFEGGLAFMFETNAMLRLTPFALDRGKGMLQEEYYKCWEGLPRAKLPA